MAGLFQTTTDNISLHLKHIYAEEELDENSTTEDYSIVRQEGQRQVERQLEHYNLEAILAVGYRVFLQDWESKLNQFLEFNERAVLDNAGKISKKQADEKAHNEYQQYRQVQRSKLESQQESHYLEELRKIAQPQKFDKT